MFMLFPWCLVFSPTTYIFVPPNSMHSWGRDRWLDVFVPVNRIQYMSSCGYCFGLGAAIVDISSVQSNESLFSCNFAWAIVAVKHFTCRGSTLLLRLQLFSAEDVVGLLLHECSPIYYYSSPLISARACSAYIAAAQPSPALQEEQLKTRSCLDWG